MSREEFEPEWLFQRGIQLVDKLIVHLLNVRVDLDQACFGRDQRALAQMVRRLAALERVWEKRTERENTALTLELVNRIEHAASAASTQEASSSRELKHLGVFGASAAHSLRHLFPERDIMPLAPAIQAVVGMWIDRKQYRRRWRSIFEIAQLLGLSPQSPETIERTWQAWKSKQHKSDNARLSAQVVEMHWTNDSEISDEQRREFHLLSWVHDSLLLLESLTQLWTRARTAAAPPGTEDVAQKVSNVLRNWHVLKLSDTPIY